MTSPIEQPARAMMPDYLRLFTLFGIAHGCLFFPCVILTICAVTGSILYLVRDWPGRMRPPGA